MFPTICFTLIMLLVLPANGDAIEPSLPLPKSMKATVDEQGVQHISIIAGSYFFRPKHVLVEVNKPVKLSVAKEPGLIPHSFVIQAPEAGISINISLDTEPKIVTFTPIRTGRFTFYCDNQLLFFESHREKGMTGVLEVVYTE
ncbi:quinol oxidase [Nitrosococcus wardiae]|uniref:Quinol oxidase n=1 Tax=Nitrosococcus wardiae TaxID=1814290 RepID=A0A4P7C2T6_9GAMM|nr:quinol oxidase [Nitrosococcus wardiae]QBQ55166.1 quinol oxidase [Nitrosococcus wardiae]